MKKSKIISLLSLTTSLCFFSVVPLLNTSCSKKTPDKYTFIGNTEGTDWEGYKSGTLELELGTTPDNDDIYTCSIVSNDSYEAKDLVIPEFVSDGSKLYRIVSIGTGCFYNSDLTKNQMLSGSITFPDSLTTIDVGAFYNCNLITSVIFNNGLKNIAAWAFTACTALTGLLNVPDSVTSIGKYAFNGCSKIASVSIGNNMESIGERAFLGCTDLLGTYDSNDGYENKKVSFNSIDNVYYLRNDDIYYCLGKYDNFEYSEIIPTPSGNIDIISGTKIICGSAFDSCGGIYIVSFPNTLKLINSYAFERCVELTTNLAICSLLTSIGDHAFYGCIGLTGTLTITSLVTSIGDHAFYGCIGLTGALTIPDSVINIGKDAFRSCANISSVSIGSGLQVLGERAFYGCIGLITDYNTDSNAYPNNKISCDDDNVYYLRSDNTYYCLGNCANLDQTFDNFPSGNINIINGTKIMCGNCFLNCENINSVVLSDSVQYLGRSVFNTCVGITQSDLDLSNIISIGIDCFYSSKFSGTLTISNNLKNIGENIIAFSFFSSIIMKNFTNDFSYDGWNTDAFIDAKADGTVSVSGGNITSQEALAILKSKGLLSSWTVA